MDNVIYVISLVEESQLT